MTEVPLVLTEKHDDVLVVTINRPQVRNAVDRATAEALCFAFESFEQEHELSVAVLTGAGGTFCAGADLKSIASSDRENANRVERHGPGPMGPTRIQLSKPVIAAVEGHCVAGGLELALWCDLRVAANDSVFGVFCRRWGVPLIDGGTVRLPRLIGQSRALDMIITGRPVNGYEALAMGLVNRLCDPGNALPDALALAHQVASFPQKCLRSDRSSVYEQWDLDFAGAMANETGLGISVLKSGETILGAQNFAGGAGRHGSFGR